MIAKVNVQGLRVKSILYFSGEKADIIFSREEEWVGDRIDQAHGMDRLLARIWDFGPNWELNIR